MEGVKCQKCGQNRAAVKVTRVIGGKARSVYLCKDCAAEVSPLQQKGFSLQEAIEQVLHELVEKQTVGGAEGEDESSALRCSACGLTFGDYRKSFMLGCSRCYSAFGRALDPQLRKIHGSTRHVGRTPKEVARSPVLDTHVTIAALKRDLQQAVACEDFEKAAQLRDRIRQLQDGLDHVFPEVPKV